jgi:hypothetical protein
LILFFAYFSNLEAINLNEAVSSFGSSYHYGA